MKKLLIIILLFFSMAAISVSAEEVTYQNVITDKTTIEEDFKVLNMACEDYYIPKAYDYDKWYVIAMSEAYVDNQIQTYFYLYNPAGLTAIPPLSISYSIDNGNVKSIELTVLQYDPLHGYLKANGFKYAYTPSCTISVSEIISTYEEDDPINSGEVIKTERKDSSGFEANLSHSKLNDSFGIELNYNSLIVIEEVKPVRVVIKDGEDSFVESWKNLWYNGTYEDVDPNHLSVYFYNFNFPEKYKNTDKVTKAVFSYDYVHYKYKYKRDSWNSSTYSELVESSEDIESIQQKPYEPGNTTLSVNGGKVELTFPTFYLGNRIKDNQFGSLDLYSHQEEFNYDCSVLLDSQYETITVDGGYGGYKTIDGTNLKNIEMLELHFECNGRAYRCQTVTKPSDPVTVIPSTPGERELSWFEKLLIRIADFILKILHIDSTIVPNWGKYMISSAVLLVGLIICVVLLPWLLSKIPGIGGAFGKIFSAIVTGIEFVITLPFRIIAKIFNMIRGD